MGISKLDRQLYLLRALDKRKNGRSIVDLHRELTAQLGVEVSVRTIYRDVDDLSLQFPIDEETRENKSYFRLMDHFKLEEMQCSFDELMALVFIYRLLEALGSDPVVDAGLELTGRLIKSLPELQQRYLEELRQHFRVDFSGYQRRDGQIIQTVIEAVRCQKEVRIRYHAFHSDVVSERIIQPYTIYFRQQYYIVAKCTVRNSIREFRLDRVIEAEQLETSFKPDPDFDYEEYIRGCWDALRGEQDYSVVLHFGPEHSRFIREYHGSKADKLTSLPGGGLEFCKRVSTLEEIFPWVLSHGPEVEVIEPAKLKDMVRETVRRQAKRLGLS